MVETSGNGADEEKSNTRRDDAVDRKIRARKLERLLKKKLSEFLDSTVLYSLRRVLPAELNTTYLKQFSAESQPSLDKSDRLVRSLMSSSETCEPNELKGGFKITRYLTYNCLVSDATTEIAGEYSGNMQRHWKCTHCNKDFVFSLKERMEHEVSCQLNSEAVGDETGNRAGRMGGTSKVLNGVDYFCPVCKETLNLTPVDILKHKRSHS